MHTACTDVHDLQLRSSQSIIRHAAAEPPWTCPDYPTSLLRVLITAAHTPAQSLYSIDTNTTYVAVQYVSCLLHL